MSDKSNLVDAASEYRDALSSAADQYDGDSKDLLDGLIFATNNLLSQLGQLDDADPDGNGYASAIDACASGQSAAEATPSDDALSNLVDAANSVIEALNELV